MSACKLPDSFNHAVKDAARAAGMICPWCRIDALLGERDEAYNILWDICHNYSPKAMSSARDLLIRAERSANGRSIAQRSPTDLNDLLKAAALRGRCVDQLAGGGTEFNRAELLFIIGFLAAIVDAHWRPVESNA